MPVLAAKASMAISACRRFKWVIKVSFEFEGGPDAAGLAGFAIRCCEHAIGVQAPVGAAREALVFARAEDAGFREIRHPRLALGGAARAPGREPGLAHRLGGLAHLFAAAPSVLDRPLEKIGGLLL